MANRNTTPADFEAVLKEEAEKYHLPERKLWVRVSEQIAELVAKQIAERVVSGKVTPPPKLRAASGTGIGREE